MVKGAACSAAWVPAVKMAPTSIIKQQISKGHGLLNYILIFLTDKDPHINIYYNLEYSER